MAGVLDGIKIVSMEQWTVLPMATVYLADWGADVVGVEPVTGEPTRGLVRIAGGVPTRIRLGGVEVNPVVELLHNRNKRNMAVNLKKESGRDILCQLVQKSDVFLSNYEMNTLKKLRLDYDTLSQLNPRLIYGILNGYGSKGPDKDEPGYDEVSAWARSGLEYLVTHPGGSPPKQPPGMGDRNTSVHIVAGVVGALLNRERTGKGQELEFSLFHCALWSISRNIQSALSGLPESGNVPRTKAYNPIQTDYRTKDDRWIRFCMPQSDRYWPDFCRTVDRPELENDPRFNNMDMRRQNCEELIRILDEVFASKTIEEWEKLCRKHNLIYSRVQTPAEVVTDPQALANDYFVDLPHPAGRMKALASPTKFYQNPASARTPAPELGQHNEEILLDLGYSREDITQLKEQGVIL